LQSKAQLVFLSGEKAGQTVVLEQGRTVIGRQVGDLIIPDKEISSIHAIISFERGGWYVMDLGSTNGVFVDDQVKLEARLKGGTDLRIGQTRLRFEVQGEETDVAGPPDLLAEGSNSDLTLPHVPKGGTLTAREAAAVRDQVAREEEKAVTAALFADDEADARPATASGPKKSAENGPQVQVSLEIIEGADKGAIRRYTSESILIGRLNTDLVVRDSDVSRRHSIIEVFDASQIYLRDLNSTNGTFVNGRRVSSVRLRNGDQIRLGRCVVRYSARPL
jgi:pSer/pThr/pTyr-binding forkhead associated (FHA) protein